MNKCVHNWPQLSDTVKWIIQSDVPISPDKTTGGNMAYIVGETLEDKMFEISYYSFF